MPMSAFVAGTRFFVSGKKVIAGPPPTVHPATGNILYSPDGRKFYVVLGQSGASEQVAGGGYSWYNFYFDIPALNLTDAKLVYSSGETDTVTWGTVTYELDESFVPATGIKIIELKPVMEVLVLVYTDAGYVVQAQNKVDGEIYTYFNGRPVQSKPGTSYTRGIVATIRFSGGHDLTISNNQTAIFDGHPAQVLDPEDYVLDFADDLKSVVVRKK